MPPPESLAVLKESPSWMKETDSADGAEKMNHSMHGGSMGNMPGMEMPADGGKQAAPGKEKPHHMHHAMPGGMKMDKQMPEGMAMPPAEKKKGEKKKKDEPQMDMDMGTKPKQGQHEGMGGDHQGLEKAIERSLEQHDGGTDHEGHQ